MAFIAAKCTRCGSFIVVDDFKNVGVYNNYGTAFATEKLYITILKTLCSPNT